MDKQTNKQVYYKQQSTTIRAGWGESKAVPTFIDVTPVLEDNYTTARADLLATSRWQLTILSVLSIQLRLNPLNYPHDFKQ
jgi:hypothetical protein